MTKSEELLEKRLKVFWKLVDSFSEPRKTQVKMMMEGKIGEVYFTAPASAREEYHSCFPGGLLYHSLNVVAGLNIMTQALCPGEFSDEKLKFVGLFHDLGKVGDGDEEYYLPNPSDWHRQKGILYEINKKCDYAPTSERGLFLLQKNAIQLDYDEWAAIRLNDGQYDETNKSYRMREPRLALLVHWADMWATQSEKSVSE